MRSPAHSIRTDNKMASLELGKMTLPQLEKLQARVEKAIVSAKGRKKKEAMAAMEKAAKEFGLSVSEVLNDVTPPKKRGRKAAGEKVAKPKATKGKAKFANPADPSQTWTGKGRQPVWYKSAVEAGTDPATMAV